MTSETHLPLSGLRILDLTTTIFGPYTTQILGDFGADNLTVARVVRSNIDADAMPGALPK